MLCFQPYYIVWYPQAGLPDSPVMAGYANVMKLKKATGDLFPRQPLPPLPLGMGGGGRERAIGVLCVVVVS